MRSLCTALARSVLRGTAALILLIFLAAGSLIPLAAQEDNSRPKWWLENGWGINLFGPALHMADLMSDGDFDKTTFSSRSGDPIEQPHYDPCGGSLQLSLSHRLGVRSRLGILAAYSMLREVSGNHAEAGYFEVHFSNISAIPLFTYELGKQWETQAGPALMFNMGRRSDFYNDEPENNFTKLSTGLHLGVSLIIWDSTVLYGKLKSQCMLTYRNKMGPYTMIGWNDIVYSLPESKLGFSHMVILFAMGVHL